MFVTDREEDLAGSYGATVVILVTADNPLGPYQLGMRGEHFVRRGPDDPRGNRAGDERIEERISGDDQQKAGRDGSKRNPYVAEIMDVGKPDRGVVLARLQQQAGHAEVRRSGGKPDHDRNEALDRNRIEKPFVRLPQQHGADRNEPDRVEQVGGSEKKSGWPCRPDERQIQTYERQLVGEVVNAIHDEGEAAGPIASSGLDGKDAGVERGRGGDLLAIVGHGFRPRSGVVICNLTVGARWASFAPADCAVSATVSQELHLHLPSRRAQ